MGDSEKKYSSLESFGQRLTKARRKKGMTQLELSKLLGYSTSGSVCQIEAGKTPPNVLILAKIADILTVDLHWLITGTASRAVIRLKPLAIHHLDLRQQDITKLRTEMADLRIRESFGEFHGSRNDEIEDQLETLHLYCQAVRKSLNEVLDDIGESI